MVDIQITDLTNGTVVDGEWSGTGIFDVLMEAINNNINIQYENGRIKGEDYANVYLGSMQSVIQQSMQFLLQEKVVESEIALKEEQIKGAYVERVFKDKQTAKLGLDNVIKLHEELRDADSGYVYTPQYEVV